jgi:hypothetical protein
MDHKKESIGLSMAQLSLHKSIAAIYAVANSPLTFYAMMRDNYYVREISKLPTTDLVKEFQRRIGIPLNNSSEVAEAYAFFIALTFKNKTEVEDFFKQGSKLQFEWFPVIANMFLVDNTPSISYHDVQMGSQYELEQVPVAQPEEATINFSAEEFTNEV